ncbi:uncharacterized protein LOC133736633 isoform X3 [Rosa rugosa]|uniref:uncharacterized protein LOC133736633 isoform X3 n=1 Tax=Rosa rugosa TaxID=74645 RepID=UPI002B416ADA|nr:uncharacterized protein LOC133736633 isoform X3 [Rosa rugosa]
MPELFSLSSPNKVKLSSPLKHFQPHPFIFPNQVTIQLFSQLLEEEPLDSLSSDGMDEDLQSNHTCSIIEGPIVNGSSMIDASDEFLSLSTKLFENREDLISDVRKIGLLQGYVMVIKRSKGNRYVVIEPTLHLRTRKRIRLLVR